MYDFQLLINFMLVKVLKASIFGQHGFFQRLLMGQKPHPKTQSRLR